MTKLSSSLIMDNALAAVKGTAFRMDEAATTAASAVAAGVKPGQDLTKYLCLVGDAATIAGTDMSSMGSIFNTALAGDAPDVLDEFERAMLDLEGQRFKYAGIKREAIRELMVEHGYRDHSPDIRFYQILNQLIERPAAWEYAPALMKRLAEKRSL